ncbi:hypothetical protein DH2020_021618 [Rehmannia glutinosa]|uniref:ABC1 atypical kinase-like domain-containing protein n=1 Tax=Rehmannia glutinosa TaxID=99300 RepID=A0ABR0WD81_REHGL
MASVSSLVPVLSSARTTTPRTRKNDPNRISKSVSPNKKQKLSKNGGGLGNIVEVVQKDVAFLKAGFSKGLRWANNAFRIPEVSKSVEDLISKSVEDPQASLFRFPSWPQPYYPELSGVDLFLADLKAMEVYVGYFYYLSKMWTKPLPEIYDAEKVTEYFTLRPHVVTLRLLEVFTAFVSATIKFRISRISSAEDEDAGGNVSDHNFGIVLKETMLNLGPTFIKVGQSLSTRPDIIGYDIAKIKENISLTYHLRVIKDPTQTTTLNVKLMLSEAESERTVQLEQLHRTVRAARSNPSFSRAEAMKIIEEELGSPVYKASTHDGFDVAVKVQRLTYALLLFEIFIFFLGLLQKIANRKNDLRLYADELGKGFIGELDYNLEAANALEFMEVHSRFTFICSPKVFQHLSKKRVLTMEWMVGDSPSELISVSSQESNRKLLDLVNKGVEASLVQLLETGLMHADPHPGNLRYISSGKIGFLDFGLLCRMEKKHQFAMLASIVHIVNGDWASLVYDLTEMDVVRPGTNIRRFTMVVSVSGIFVGPGRCPGELEFNNGMPNVKFSRVLGKIWSVALKYHCRMPPYYILVLRSLASLEGLAVAADPTFKTLKLHILMLFRNFLLIIPLPRGEFYIRKGLQSLVPLSTQTSLTQSANGVGPMVDLANLALRILPSKNGLVLRRLLMTADGASLVRALVSNEASPFRQQLCKIVADILYQWMCEALEKGLNFSKFNSRSHTVVKMLLGFVRRVLRGIGYGLSQSVGFSHWRLLESFIL